MKKTDLEKLNGLKIRDRMKNAGTPNRFGKDNTANGGGVAINPLVEKLLKKGLADKNPT
ncbi:hypothetical protein [Aromatoleum diolicum]|uniref:hypothetical protein n=1 Tax=Aromatoleum diolicum TaxID=75796 RepID=UPI00145D0C70|nr:hypothetical protein [Aromatoleum diolicum]